MHALYASGPAGRRAGRLPRPARAASSTSWASSRPTPTQALHRRVLGARPGARRPARADRATCRGAAPRWSAGTRTIDAVAGGAAGGAAGDPHRGRRASGSPGSRSRWPAASATGSPTARWLVRARRRSPTAARSAHAVAAALGVQQRPRPDDRADASSSTCAARSLLLVLDNCEHVLDAAARLVAEIVRALPRRRRCSPPAGNALGVDGRAACGRCRRCRSRTPSRALRAAGAGRAARTSTSTGRRAGRRRRSARGSTGCRWASSWPRPGCGR